MIIKAIKIANNQGVRTTNYIAGILKSWVGKGYKVLADIQQEDREYKKDVKQETEEEKKARILKEMEEYQKKNDNAGILR